jgi:hypothetical protein
MNNPAKTAGFFYGKSLPRDLRRRKSGGCAASGKWAAPNQENLLVDKLIYPCYNIFTKTRIIEANLSK